MKVELEIPKEYEKLFKGVNVKSIVEKSLKQTLASEFRRQLFMNLLKELSYKPKSRVPKVSLQEFPEGKMNKRKLKRISEEVKEGIAKRHGL
jgi:hypothetical protein